MSDEPLAPASPAASAALARAARNARWQRQLLRWHGLSSALALAGMLLFAVTGLTLNNAGWMEAAEPTVRRFDAPLPAALQPAAGARALGEPLRDWMRQTWQVALPETELAADGSGWTASVPRPGGEAALRYDARDGRLQLELLDRGWVAYLNDLHKGRHAGVVWSWFIDLFALACLVFCLTGLLILKQQAAARPSIVPLGAAGVLLPLLLVLLWVH